MYKFAVFGDSRNQDKPLWTILNELKKRKDLEFAVHTGDVVVGTNRRDKFKEYLDRIDDIPFPVYTCRGNHDIGLFDEDDFPALEKYETWKKTGFKRPDRFLKLDNSEDQWGEDQRKFIEKWLDGSTRNFVFCHKPLDDVVFPDGRRVSHNQGEKPNGNKDARWLRSLAKKNNVEMIACGHYHAHAVQMIRENIITLLEGRAGAPMYGNRVPYGYSIVYVWPDSWTIQKIDIEI